jgi:hypothetical protein
MLTQGDRQKIDECAVMLRREVLRVETLYHSRYSELGAVEKENLEMASQEIRSGIDRLAKLT